MVSDTNARELCTMIPDTDERELCTMMSDTNTRELCTMIPDTDERELCTMMSDTQTLSQCTNSSTSLGVSKGQLIYAIYWHCHLMEESSTWGSIIDEFMKLEILCLEAKCNYPHKPQGGG